MNQDKNVEKWFGELGAAIGRGLLAGAAGTCAFTLSEWIERKLGDKPPRLAPANAASKALNIEAANRENWLKFSKKVHWTYGTLWGIARGIISMAGVKGWPATVLHFAAIYYTAIRIEPDFEVAPPLAEWSMREISLFGLHHLVYVVVAGAVFDAISKEDAAKK